MKASVRDPNKLKGGDAALILVSIVIIAAATGVLVAMQPPVYCKNVNFSVTDRTAYLAMQLAQPNDLTFWIYRLAMTESDFDQPENVAMASMYIPSSTANADFFRTDWIGRLESGLPSCAHELFVTPAQGMEPIYKFIRGHNPAYDLRIIYVYLDVNTATDIGQYLDMLVNKYIYAGEGHPTVACRGIGVLFYGPLLLATRCEPDPTIVRAGLVELSGQATVVAAINQATSYCPGGV